MCGNRPATLRGRTPFSRLTGKTVIVILGTSVLCQDIRLTGSGARVFLGNVKLIPATILVPEVVIDEVTNHFREKLEAAQREFAQAQRRLTALLSDPRPTLESAPIECAASEYRQSLLKQLSDAGGRTLPYPDIPHHKIVERDLMRRKPFKRDGSGYRDLLIWESVRRVMRGGHERIAFLTANTRDFAANGEIHGDLATDVLNPKRIELFTSLKEFNNRHIHPRQQTADRLQQELRSILGVNANLAEWIREHLLVLLKDEDLDWLGDSEANGAIDFWACEIVSFDDLRMVSASRLDDGELFCEVIVRASVNISAHDYYASWYQLFVLSTSIEITMNSDASRVTSHEVTRVEEV